MEQQYKSELFKVVCRLRCMSDAEINEFQEEFIKEHGDPNGAAKRIFEAVKASKKQPLVCLSYASKWHCFDTRSCKIIYCPPNRNQIARW